MFNLLADVVDPGIRGGLLPEPIENGPSPIIAIIAIAVTVVTITIVAAIAIAKKSSKKDDGSKSN